MKTNRLYFKMGGLSFVLELADFKKKGRKISEGLLCLGNGFISKEKISSNRKINIISLRKKRTVLNDSRKLFLKRYYKKIVDNSHNPQAKKGQKYFIENISLYAYDKRFINLIDGINEDAGDRIIPITGYAVYIYKFKIKKSFLFLDVFDKNIDHISRHIFSLLRSVIIIYYLEQNSIVLHGAGAKIREKGFLFLGNSGVGKTTLCSFFPKKSVFSDEVVVIKKSKSKYFIFSSPFGDFSNKSFNEKVRIHKVFSLVKSSKTYIENASKARLMAETMVMNVFISPFFGPNILTKAMNMLFNFFNSTPCCELHFRKDMEFLKYLE